MTTLIQCDLCKAMEIYPLPNDSGWYGISLYKMGVRKTKGGSNKVRGVTTVCPVCFKKLSFLKVA